MKAGMSSAGIGIVGCEAVSASKAPPLNHVSLRLDFTSLPLTAFISLNDCHVSLLP